MFDTDLVREYEAAASSASANELRTRTASPAALCDGVTRERLRSIGESFDWRSLP